MAFDNFRRFNKEAQRFGAIERRVYEVYSRDGASLRRLFQGSAQIRTQTGMAEEFRRAAERAQAYIGYMEKIFNDNNVPAVITRLTFVESMFNTDARSKVGAAGVWQFMSATAQKYLLINRLIDERNSPLKATRAAAKLLSENYQELKSWPLAITAYNHGAYGLQQGVKTVGSRNLGDLINRYESPSFGYASKNFYAEFIAATRAYDHVMRNNLIRKKPPPKLSSVVLNKRLSVHELLGLSSLRPEVLELYNRCLRRESFAQLRNDRLPKSFEIFLPTQMAKSVIHELNVKFKKQWARARN